jgi:hypothetical protein
MQTATSHSYYVVAIRYQRRWQDGVLLPAVTEAVVRPDASKDDILSEVRDVLASMDREIDFIDFIDGNYKETVTKEICAEAGYPDAPLSPVNRVALKHDHERALRKESV